MASFRGLSSAEREELRAARRPIKELETELAVHRRAAELLKEVARPFGGSRRFAVLAGEGTLGRRTHLRLAAQLQTTPRLLRPPPRNPRSLPRHRLLPRLFQETSALILIRLLSAPTH